MALLRCSTVVQEPAAQLYAQRRSAPIRAGTCTFLVRLLAAVYVVMPLPAPAQVPDGVRADSDAGSFSVQRMPTRSLKEVLDSIAGWQHQTLADGSTVDFTVDDSALSMRCTACGFRRSSAIELAAIDLNSIVAYEAGTWHLGAHSRDGREDFFGVLRGEVGPPPHDPGRVGADRQAALTALVDVYDLAYLTQRDKSVAAPRMDSVSRPAAPPAIAAVPAPPESPAPKAAAAGSPAALAPAPPESSAPKAAAAGSLAALAASGDIEGVQMRLKANPRDGPRALERAYATRARQQLLDGEVDAALSTLGAGRQKFGKSETLRDQEEHYVLIGDAYDRLRLAVTLNVGVVERYLQHIQGIDPGDGALIEQMLARVLADRIADQRAAGRVKIADDLLRDGQQAFPTRADLLAHGRAGALPETGVETSVDEAPQQRN
jgi:hypothetical protein